jgi:hypothetical protein
MLHVSVMLLAAMPLGEASALHQKVCAGRLCSVLCALCRCAHSRPAAADVAVGASELGLLVVKSFLAHGSSLRLRYAWCKGGLSHRAVVGVVRLVIV